MKPVLIFVGSFVGLATSLLSQVPVRNEPRHHVALENEYIRLLDVRLPPGDTSLFHIHEIPSFFIPLSTTAVGSQVMGQPAKQSRFSSDSTWFNGFENGPLVHRVWNSDTAVMHVIDLELLSHKNVQLPQPAELNSLKVDFENEKLRVYKFGLAPNQHLSLPLLKSPMLVISVTGPVVMINTTAHKDETYRVPAQGFKWLPADQRFQISNDQNSLAHAILILLK